MTAKQFLNRAFLLDKHIEKKTDEIARIRARMEKATATLSDMPRGGSGVDWTDVDIHVLEEEERIKQEIEELCRIKREIRDAIEAVEEKRYRDLLDFRYRYFMKWEQIALEMNYSYDWVRHMHKEALKAVKLPDEIRHSKTH